MFAVESSLLPLVCPTRLFCIRVTHEYEMCHNSHSILLHLRLNNRVLRLKGTFILIWHCFALQWTQIHFSLFNLRKHIEGKKTTMVRRVQ